MLVKRYKVAIMWDDYASRSNVQHHDYSYCYCIEYWKCAKRINLRCSHHNERIVSIREDMLISWNIVTFH